jgi:putative transcriptional regulator
MRAVARRLFVCVLACGLSIPALAQEAEPLTAILLTARAELPDPDFRESVVLVMNNIGPAPSGLILNRPTRIDVARLFPDLQALDQVDDKVYFGGPVSVTTVSFVFRSAIAPSQHAVRILEGIYLSTNLDLLHGLLARDRPMEGLRIFIGYAGWGPGQLEAEIARGDWALAPADGDDIFESRSEHPWPGNQGPDGGRRI